MTVCGDDSLECLEGCTASSKHAALCVLQIYSVHCDSRAYLGFQGLANTCSFILVQQGSLESFLEWIELFWYAVKVCILKLDVSL